MLEPCVSQAAGLQSLALQHAPRLMAVASHGRQLGELPLLWGLCNCWGAHDLSVVVLDAHTRESSDNPGLRQWLDNPLQRIEDPQPDAQCLVLPAAQGLQHLAGGGPLQSTCGHLFSQRDIVLLYANATTLTRSLAGSKLSPLIIVPPAPRAVVSAYTTLKRLLQARLRPGVAQLLVASVGHPQPTNPAAVRRLTHCASSYLGIELHPSTIVASSEPVHLRHDLQRLAMDLFENALPLEPVQCSERVH